MHAKLNPVTLNIYQCVVAGTDKLAGSGLDGLSFLLLGLYGEVGTLMSALKKRRRDRESYAGYREAVTEEFGDVLWYLTAILSRAGSELSSLATKAVPRLGKTTGETRAFSDLQKLDPLYGSSESAAFEIALIALGAETGSLLSKYHRTAGPVDVNSLELSISKIFRALVEAANLAGENLDIAAARNILKVRSRWPEEREYPGLFDEDSPPLEQLPRKLEMHIFEETAGDKSYVIQQCKGINIGSRLTDNRMVDDDYRFHDVFHLSYAAVLGWSPVLRTLFNVKRKSNPQLDEAQDGARAVLIEEGLSTLMFQRATKLNFFAGVTSLDYSMLKLIPEFVEGYEVDALPLWQWEEAILQGFAAFRFLREKRRAIITADLTRRRLSFRGISN